MSVPRHATHPPVAAKRSEPAAWGGIVPAALTMFRTNGALDEAASRAHFEYLIEQGAHGIVVGGTSGEFIALNDRERRRVIDLGVEAARGRVPVIAGTGYFTTSATIQLTKYAERAGADGAIVILPYYQRPRIDEVVAHYRALRKAVTIPIMLYNNPGNSAAPALDVPTIGTLYREGVLNGVKSTVPTVNEIHELRASLDDGFRVFYGSFMAPLEGFAGGAHGWISGILNVVTDAGVRLWEAVVRDSDLPRAQAIFTEEILPIQQIYARQPFGPVGDLVLYRAMLELRGLHGGASRLPLRPLSGEQLTRLEHLLPKGAVPRHD